MRRHLRRDPRSGFVLPTVLWLILILGAAAVVAANMARQQVRAAGEMRGSVLAFHAAEGGAAWVVNRLAGAAMAWPEDDGLLDGAALLALDPGIPTGPGDALDHGGAIWWVDWMDFTGDEVTFRVTGEISPLERQRTVEVVFARGNASPSSPFAGAVVGCNGVSLTGSGSIDSWDSSMGSYSPGLARSNASVGTLDPGGDLVLSGNAPIRGDVYSARDIRISGSSTITGNYAAVRDIVFTGNPSCPTASVEAGRNISTPGAWWANSCGAGGFQSGADVPAPTDPCDPLGIQQMMLDSLNHYRPSNGVYPAWGHTGWRPNPISIQGDTALASFSIGPGAHPVTINAGEADAIFVNGNFSLTSSSILHIQNPSVAGSPQELKIFVNGDLTAAGASRLNIDPGVSVRFYVTGRVNFTGGHNQVLPSTVNLNPGGPPEIAPTLSIYSSFVGGGQGNQAGVRVGGSSPLSASIYAPMSTVRVEGSSPLYGAVRGREVAVAGAGGIHYDEALGLMGGSPGQAAAAPRIASWSEVN